MAEQLSTFAHEVINVVFAGLGGQGVLKASDILSEAAFADGYDVKKSEIHGMSQRGGSVTSDVRFGKVVWSPMVPAGEADYVVVLAEEEADRSRKYLRRDGVMITPDDVDRRALANPRSLNVAMLGRLSVELPLREEVWIGAIRAHLPEKLHATNEAAFKAGRQAGG